MGWGQPEGMVKKGSGTIQTLYLHPDPPDHESVCPLIFGSIVGWGVVQVGGCMREGCSSM